MPDKALLVSVVDDDESVRESLPDLLIELGHSVRTFSSALEFLASDTADQTWCLLLDVSMPGMSGVELQAELKRHDKRIPIIFITATEDDAVRAQVVELGAVACLRKPFSDTALVEALRSVMTPNSVLSVDHTDIFGYNLWRTLDINPIINGVRPLVAALQSTFGSASLLGPVYIQAAVDHSHYDETVVHYERRFTKGNSFQVNYVLSWADAMAGDGDATPRSLMGVGYPQIPSPTGGYIFEPWEWGPTPYDERHRITAIGVFNLPFKIEVAPTLTFATGRPYTLFQGPNPSGEPGSLLQITNSAGVPEGIGDARGNDLFILNARVSRIFPIGSDGRYKIAAFGELYNITDRANFGNNYGDVKGTATYQLPTGYIGGFGAVSTTPNSFQVQFGARFTY